jgi:hypothetical protein
MTDDRQLSLALERWLDEGPIQMPDRVFDTVADRIARQPQRPAWRLDWRRNTMNTNLKVAASIAAVLAVAVIGYSLIPGRSTGIGGPGPTASPTASPLPTLSAAPTPMAFTSGPLAGGTYRLRPFSSMPGLSIDADVPGGWLGTDFPGFLAPGGTESPSGIGIALMRVDGLFADACRWDRAGTGSWRQPGIAVGTTVDDLVAALRANASYTSSAPVPVTIGGYAGKRVDLQLPADLDFTTCDKVTGMPEVPVQTQGNFFVFTGNEAGLHAQGPANRWQVSIIDIRGNRVVIVVTDYAGTSSADRAAAQSILDSFVISP